MSQFKLSIKAHDGINSLFKNNQLSLSPTRQFLGSRFSSQVTSSEYTFNSTKQKLPSQLKPLDPFAGLRMKNRKTQSMQLDMANLKPQRSLNPNKSINLSKIHKISSIKKKQDLQSLILQNNLSPRSFTPKNQKFKQIKENVLARDQNSKQNTIVSIPLSSQMNLTSDIQQEAKMTQRASIFLDNFKTSKNSDKSESNFNQSTIQHNKKDKAKWNNQDKIQPDLNNNAGFYEQFKIRCIALNCSGRIPESREATAMTVIKEDVFIFGGLAQERKCDLKHLIVDEEK